MRYLFLMLVSVLFVTAQVPDEATLSELKSQRNLKTKKSREHGYLTLEINSLQAKIDETQDNLKLVKSASIENWQAYKAALDSNVADLRTKDKLAE